MFETHYTALLVGYAAALGGWLAASRAFHRLWPPGGDPDFERPWRELGIGLALAALALVAYSLARAGAGAPWEIAARLYIYGHLDEAAQVFFEDVVIAILFVRLAAAIGGRRAVLVVAALFAAGHIPAMLSQGLPLSEFVALLRDVGLGVAVISVLRRARDIIWFWPVHFTMDMSQFDAITFG